jgi:hypothetical protein
VKHYDRQLDHDPIPTSARNPSRFLSLANGLRAGGFRGIRAAASLKLRVWYAEEREQDLFPRPSGRGRPRLV